MIVVDTNVIAYLFIKGDFTHHAKKLLRQDQDWIAPVLWRSEFRNVLVNYYKYQYYSKPEIFFLMNKAEMLMKSHEYHVKSRNVLETAMNSGCSAFDSEYISLALDLNIPLITTDNKILKSFPEIAKNLTDY